jgi:hypothetical protein
VAKKHTQKSSRTLDEAISVLPRALSRGSLEAFRDAAWQEATGGDAWARAVADPIAYLQEVGVPTEQLEASPVQIYLEGGDPRTFHAANPFGSPKEKLRPLCLLWAVETMVVETDVPPGPVDGPWHHSFWTVSIRHCLAEVVFDD